MSLEPDSLVPLALSLLPTPSSSSSSSSSQSAANDDQSSHGRTDNSNPLNSPLESLALLIHAIHTQLDFRLIDPKPSTTTSSEITSSNDAASATTSSAHANRLPPGWHPSGNNSIQLKYRHQQSSLEFVISIVEMGGRALIAAVAVEDNKSVSYDLSFNDYFSPSAFPLSSLSPTSYLDSFATPHRLKDLVTNYRVQIIQRIIPGLSKEGYTELPSSSSSPGSTSAGGGRPIANPQGPYYPDPGGPLIDPRAGNGRDQPRPDQRRDPDDPLRIPGSGNRPSQQGSFEIGRSDLVPLGGMHGTTGIGSNPFGAGVGGGGMFVGPDHPIFEGHFGGQGPIRGGGGGGGRWGGDGFLPPGAVPPGARFDPIGPSAGGGNSVGRGGFVGGGGGRGGGGGGGGMGRGRGGRGGAFRTGEPDWDEFAPPGNGRSDYDDMFG